MKSANQFTFAKAPVAEIPRSSFDRSMTYKTTFNAGYLVPIYVDEVLPGDTFNFKLSAFSRLLAPLKYPIMDNMKMDFRFFFVPNRLLWSNWQKCMGERDGQNDYSNDTEYTVPQINSGNGFAIGSIADYFGLPTGVAQLNVNALYFRAYNKIYNDWFRDENLIKEVEVNLGDDGDTMAKYPLLKRCKIHDYFTSALPWPQKGPGVELPLGGIAPVYGNEYAMRLDNGTASMAIVSESSGETLRAKTVLRNSQTPLKTSASTAGSANLAGIFGLATKESGKETGIYADLSSATAATINSLRQAFQLQKLYERDARGGTRYIEIIRSHFGVESPDARLQRSEYLGGGVVPINTHTVASTTANNVMSGQSENAFLGSVGAFATSETTGNIGFIKSFVEHGIIMGFVTVRADLTYQQGIDRKFSRKTRFDYYWPTLAHLGEQAVLNKEIFAQGNDKDEEVFGYQERFAEYRYSPSKITGLFRSSAAQSLDVYHLSQDFDNLPTLSQQFIEENPPVSRVVQIVSDDVSWNAQFLFDALYEVNCVRPMPVYSVPGLVDHF